MGKLKTKYGTKPAFIQSITNDDTLYALTDAHQLYRGDVKLDNIITLFDDNDVTALYNAKTNGCFDVDVDNKIVHGNTFIYARDDASHTTFDDGLYFLHQYSVDTAGEMQFRLLDTYHDDDVVRTSQLATVATTGSYNDLKDKPSGSSGIFVATYNTTTRTDVINAYNAGKQLWVKYAYTPTGGTQEHTIYVPLTQVYYTAGAPIFNFECVDREGTSDSKPLTHITLQCATIAPIALPWYKYEKTITSGGGGEDLNPALVVKGTTDKETMRAHYNANRLMYLIDDDTIYTCNQIYIDDNDVAMYRFCASRFGKSYGMSGEDISSTIHCITYFDGGENEGWLGPWRNTCLGEAPINTSMYVRSSGTWESITQTLPVVTMKGTVPTASDIPTGPMYSFFVSYSGRKVKMNITLGMPKALTLSSITIRVEPDNDTTTDAWLRNEEIWGSHGQNISIDGVTIEEIGYSVDSHTYERGDTTGVVTLTTPVTLTSTSVLRFAVMTWRDTTPDGVDHTGDWSTTTWTNTIGGLSPIATGDAYFVTSTKTSYYFDGTSWTPSRLVADHSLVPASTQLVGGTSQIATNTIRETLESHDVTTTRLNGWKQHTAPWYMVPEASVYYYTASSGPVAMYIGSNIPNGVYEINSTLITTGTVKMCAINNIVDMSGKERTVTFLGGHKSLTGLSSTLSSLCLKVFLSDDAITVFVHGGYY